jgi:hypothetical protein
MGLACWPIGCGFASGSVMQAQSGDNGDRGLGFAAGRQKMTRPTYRGSARPEAKGQLSWIAGSDRPIGGIEPRHWQGQDGYKEIPKPKVSLAQPMT